MGKEKAKELNLMINIPTLIIICILFFSPLVLTNGAVLYYVGIVLRIIIGLWCIFNGIWNASTHYYSILKNNATPHWAWWLFVVLGIGCLVTAFMGYGFNNVQKPI